MILASSYVLKPETSHKESYDIAIAWMKMGRQSSQERIVEEDFALPNRWDPGWKGRGRGKPVPSPMCGTLVALLIDEDKVRERSDAANDGSAKQHENEDPAVWRRAML